jgi:peptidoglycan-associated lipoprotein
MSQRISTQSCTSRAVRVVVVGLIVFALGACATTKKGGTGAESGSADTSASAAVKSEAGQGTAAPGAAVTGDQKTAGAGAGTAAGASPATAAKSATSEPGMEFPSQAGKTDEEVARAKQQLADEQAQINKLREEQAVARQQMEADAAKQQAGQSQGGQQAGAVAATSPPAASEAAAQSGGRTGAAAAAAEGSATAGALQKPVEHSVYFDYDQTAIRDADVSVVEANAAWIRAHPSLRVEVQGNCDERGSREYNLALGARRAEAVKRALELTGADGSRIKTVSFGSEKPVASGHDEQSYAKNRRADIVY